MTPRARARLLARGATPEPPLFLPLAHRIAAAIDGLSVEEFLTNPTKLARGLAALHRALETDGIVTASLWDAALAAPPEAAAGHPRVEAAFEATRRLAATVGGEPLLAVVLPTSLEAPVAVELTRRFCEAGATAIVLVAAEVPEEETARAAWRSALTTVTKMARFHQALAVLVPTARGAERAAVLRGSAPPGIVHPETLPEDPSQWMPPPPGSSLVTTLTEIPQHAEIAGLRDACLRVRPKA